MLGAWGVMSELLVNLIAPTPPTFLLRNSGIRNLSGLVTLEEANVLAYRYGENG